MLPWSWHSFRHTMSTEMNEHLGIEPHVVEMCLGHVVPGISGLYNHATYVKKRRDVLARWENDLDVLLAKGRGENLERLRSAR